MFADKLSSLLSLDGNNFNFQDIPFSGKTSTIRDTSNPEYEKTFVIPIQRNSRQCQRVFKRQGIKFEVYSKG